MIDLLLRISDKYYLKYQVQGGTFNQVSILTLQIRTCFRFDSLQVQKVLGTYENKLKIFNLKLGHFYFSLKSSSLATSGLNSLIQFKSSLKAKLPKIIDKISEKWPIFWRRRHFPAHFTRRRRGGITVMLNLAKNPSGVFAKFSMTGGFFGQTPWLCLHKNVLFSSVT